MKIKKFELRNYRGAEHLTLDFEEKATVLAGVNGSGKTGILEALAIMLSRLIGRICSSSGTGRFFTEADVRNGASEMAADMEISFSGRAIDWRVSKAAKKTKRQTITNLEKLRTLAEDVREELETGERRSLPVAVYYSVNRSVLDVPLRIRKKHPFDQLAAYEAALDGKRNDFRLFFEWFRNREDYENEVLRDRAGFVDPQLNAVRQAIERFTGFTKIRVRRSPLRMEVLKNGETFDVRQLSDGEKCLLALVGDLARRLAIANPSENEPLRGSGVVLVDELDLHLHPAWQRDSLAKLTSVFPNCQFIVTTHSPQILGEVEARCIRLLRVSTDRGLVVDVPERSLGLDSSEILEELMETNRRDGEIEKELSRIDKLIDKERFDQAKARVAKLKKKISGNIPALLRAETHIAMLEYAETPEDSFEGVAE